MLAKGEITMTFNAACIFCYEDFKKEYGTGIGKIQDCGEYWVFYKKSDEPEYGALPMIVYKGDKQPIPMTFDVYLQLAEEMDGAKFISVPEKFM